jgi:phosphoenolpyruvate-protein kinase (PTS system EI component)
MKKDKSNGTAEAPKFSAEDLEALQNELQASQAASDNLALAQAAETKAADLQQKLTQAETDLEANDTVILGLKSELADAKEEIGSKDEEIAQLKEALIEEKEEEGDKAITFNYEGVKYEILGSVRIPGGDHPAAYSPLEIASEEKLQAILVSRKSGMIREIK